MHGQSEFFIPAETLEEAVERIFALTGRGAQGSRGQKRALLALRDALGLNLDAVAVGSVMGRRVAEALGVEWDEDRFTLRSTITLPGLNALLQGASEQYRRGSLAQLVGERPASLSGPEWTGFRPARKKIEAVTRIAGLTEAPAEWLGPGGKERKSVFVNLAHALFPEMSPHGLSKTQLGRALAERLGVPWTDSCYSTQQSVTLVGLNTILAGAERHLGRLGSTAADSLGSAVEEGCALAAALLDGLPRHWDGRKCVEWMHERGIRGWADNEWQGFYNEAVSKGVLARAFPPSSRQVRVRYGNTTFDYSLNHVWDFKAHTEWKVLAGTKRPGNSQILLNDEEAIRECVSEQGLGFLILSGGAIMDDAGDFVRWQRALKQKTPAPRNNAHSRLRKRAFQPLRIEAFWLENPAALDAAVVAGQLRIGTQGRQAPKVVGAPGRPRRDKFQLNMSKARRSLAVVDYFWPATSVTHDDSPS